MSKTVINKKTNPQLNKTIKQEVKRRTQQALAAKMNKTMPVMRVRRIRNPTMPINTVRRRNAPGNRYFSNANPAKMRRYKDVTTLQYYSALLDPEFAVTNKVDCKFPEPYPLPTQTIHLANDWTLAPNSEGKALITWRPYYMTTVDQEKWLGEHVLKQYIQTQHMAGYNTIHLDRTRGDYAQITINNSESLDGESINTNNNYKPMKYLTLPILKYRLIGAKLVIRYNGRADDEAGSITYGQYTGTLGPVRYGSVGASFTDTYSVDHVPAEVVKEASAQDQSQECGKFGVFDNIRSLPYSNKEPFIKGKKYSFYFYPFDNSSSDFKHIGGYGDIEEVGIDSATVTPVGDDARHNLIYISKNQIEQEITMQTTELAVQTTTSSRSEGSAQGDVSILQARPGITVPSYVIALDNMTSGESNTINVSLYETYECICSQDMNLVASVSRPTINVSKAAVQRIQNTIMSNPGSQFSGLSNPGLSNSSISLNESNQANAGSLMSTAKRLAKTALFQGGRAIANSLGRSLLGAMMV